MSYFEYEPVVVSLTTINTRLKNIGKVIDSLISQNYPNFHIVLYLSHEGYLLDEGIDCIPIDLINLCENNNNLSIQFTENIGPYRKLIPSLKKYWNENQLLVTVDDDVFYPSNFLSTLVVAEKIHNCPVAFRGRSAKINEHGFAKYQDWEKTNLSGRGLEKVPTGKDGVAYRPKYFSKNVLDIETALSLAKTADDLWFKWNTALNGKESCLLFDSLSDSFENITDQNDSGPTLFNDFNQHGKNDDVVKALEFYFKEKIGINVSELIFNSGRFFNKIN